MVKLEMALINATFLLWGFSFNLWFQWKPEENLLFLKWGPVFKRESPSTANNASNPNENLEWNYSIKKCVCAWAGTCACACDKEGGSNPAFYVNKKSFTVSW